MFNRKKFSICMLLAFLSSIALNLSLNTVSNEVISKSMLVEKPHALFRLLWDFKISLSGYQTESIFILIAISVLFYIIWKYETKLSICAVVLSAIFSFFQVFGTSFKATASWELIFGCGRNFIKASVAFIGFGILFYFIICGIFVLFRNFAFVKEDAKVTSWFTTNRKSLFVVAGLILLMWLPYFIACFPGLTNYDFFDMLDTFYGRDTTSLRVVTPIDPSVTLNNNNPVCQTLMAVTFMKIGNLFGSPYIGLFLFVTVQAILFALVLSYAIRFLAKKNINKKVRIVLLLMYGLVPLHANFAFTTLKDTNFTFVTLLYLLMLIELVLDAESFVSSKWNLTKFAIVTLVMMFLRNNGLYIIALSAVILMIAYRKHFKKLVLPFFVPIIVFMLTTNVIYPALKISPGSAAEAYSIPFQQIARLVKEHGDDLPKEDQEKIAAVLNYDVLADVYNPELSDPVKVAYIKERTDQQFSDFLGVWAKYLPKYPGLYVQATMSNCYGYFFPEAKRWLTYTTIAPTGEPYGLTTLKPLDTIRGEMTQVAEIVHSFPAIGMSVSIGFYVWALFCMAVVLIRYKEKKKIFMMVPMFILLLTAIAGPANTMVRYVYPIIVSAPIYVAMTGYIVSTKNKED